MNTTLYTIIPRRLTSRIMFYLARIRKTWLKNQIIKIYMRITGADTHFAAEKDPYAYPTLDAFFTRKLAPNARLIDHHPKAIVSPVDGRCAIHEPIKKNTLLQAKGITYSLEQLLGNSAWAKQFINGYAITLYLAPDDYHRIHMPYSGTLNAMRFCPGDKHSVALSLLAKIPNIFAGNERVVTLFDTELGKMAVVMVGALNVSSISTSWHGRVTQQSNNTYCYNDTPLHINKGDEIGCFHLGSTVILLFEQNAIAPDNNKLNIGEKIFMGESIGRCA